MIILDTNVLSELMRKVAEKRVLKWIEAQSSASLFTTALTEAEVLYGLASMPTGKRRKALEDAAAGLFSDFEPRILAFDSAAARAYAQIVLGRTKAGRPMSVIDAQIAAIARSRGAHLATRNHGDFEDCGVDLIDPWL